MSITDLENHPNLETILGVLAQLPHIRDDELPRLASAWRNTIPVAAARRKALSPDSPLVVEVLAAFDALVYLFADDLAGDCDFITVEPQVTSIALKAVRDAIAAVYARPILSRGEYRTLLRGARSTAKNARSALTSAPRPRASAVCCPACRGWPPVATTRKPARRTSTSSSPR
jgi:hypothetical protein